MSIKPVTLLKKIDSLNSKENTNVIMDYHNYMKKGSSENHIINNLKLVDLLPTNH